MLYIDTGLRLYDYRHTRDAKLPVARRMLLPKKERLLLRKRRRLPQRLAKREARNGPRTRLLGA